ncbi:MAG: hypothetical protein IJV51_03220 [Oscillospiraceae bacterium]|nr:hypothetical protein [Oscillospiraceae bacterium]
MAGPSFEPERALGKKLTEMDKQELCAFISDLCSTVVAEVGSRGRRGGIYPDNISIDSDGRIAVGPAGKSPWQGQELEFIAPEQYWDGQLSAATDVYAVGLLMYYAVNDGKLPFAGERDAQLKRMGGGNPAAPRSAGRRLGAIIEKSIRFKPAERYQTLEELRVVVDSCLKNLYTGGVPSAEAIFKKNDSDLNDVERMMVGIVEKNEDAAIEKAEVLPSGEPEDGVKVYKPVQKPAPKSASKSQQKDVISDGQADMLNKKMKTTASPAAPKLEEDGVLRPVTVSQNAAHATPAVQYKLKTDRERKIAEEVKKRRRRPLAVILVLCAVLVMVAIIMNAMLRDFEKARTVPDPMLQTTPTETSADPYAAVPPTLTPEQIHFEDFNTSTPGPSVTMDIGILPEIEEIPPEHSYQVIKDNVSWTKAAAACTRLGGHLAVINDEAEFNEITRLCDEQGLTYVWIGAHRVGGVEKWENGSDLTDGYVLWARGEPTYIDRNDQVAEDYIMLWKNNGTWAYNDNRDDPYADYPYMFEGIIGYVCEFNDDAAK